MDKKINIVYFMPGRMGHYTSMLANAVSRRVGVTIIGAKNIVNFDYINSNINIKNVFNYPVGFSVKNLLTFKNIFIVNTIKPELIHVTAPHPLITPLLLLFFAKKYPLVVTVHDPIPHLGEAEFNWRSIFGNFFQILLIKRANRVIVHSEKHKNELMKRGMNYEKIVVIPHGDYSFFTKYRKNNLPEKNCILFFGRIIKYKGLEYLIKSAPLISKEITPLKIIIAGEGDFTEYKKLIDSISIGNFEVDFEVHNKFIPNELVAELFEKANLLILPYVEATQSGPLHIAYAFKKPVVATMVGALPEVVVHGKTGLIVPPKNVEALAEAIIYLLKNNELRKEMGENANRKMKEEMSWENIADKTIDVYKKTIIEYKNIKLT